MTQIAQTDVAARAYQIWESEGRPHGCELDHWLRAEAELSVAAPATIAAPEKRREVPGTARRQRKKR